MGAPLTFWVVCTERTEGSDGGGPKSVIGQVRKLLTQQQLDRHVRQHVQQGAGALVQLERLVLLIHLTFGHRFSHKGDAFLQDRICLETTAKYSDNVKTNSLTRC